jgi:hypothetical protein
MSSAFDASSKVMMPKKVPRDLVFNELNSNVKLDRNFTRLSPIGQNNIDAIGLSSRQVTFQFPVENLLIDPRNIELVFKMKTSANALLDPLLGAYSVIQSIRLEGSNGQEVHSFADYRPFMAWYNLVRPKKFLQDELMACVVDQHRASTNGLVQISGGLDSNAASSLNTYTHSRHCNYTTELQLQTASGARQLMTLSGDGNVFRLKLHGLPEFTGQIAHLMPLALLGDMRIVIDFAPAATLFDSTIVIPFAGSYSLSDIRLEYPVVRAGDAVMADMAQLLSDGKQFTSMSLSYSVIPSQMSVPAASDSIVSAQIPVFDNKSSLRALFVTFQLASPLAGLLTRESPYTFYEPGALADETTLTASGGIQSIQLISGSAKNTPVFEISDKASMLYYYNLALEACGLECPVVAEPNLVTTSEATWPKRYAISSSLEDIQSTLFGSYHGGTFATSNLKRGGGMFALGFPLTGTGYVQPPETLDGTGLDHNMYVMIKYVSKVPATTYKVQIILAHAQMLSIARAGVATRRI